MRTLPGKIKTYILPRFLKRSCVHVTATVSNLNRFQWFLHCRTGKKLQNGACIFLFITFVANDVINVSLFAGPVCCEPRHRRVEESSVGLCRRWRRSFWTLLMIATLKIIMLKWQNCKFNNWRWLLFCFAANVNEQRIIAFLTEECCFYKFTK